VRFGFPSFEGSSAWLAQRKRVVGTVRYRACARSQDTGPCATTAGAAGVSHPWCGLLESTHGFQFGAGCGRTAMMKVAKLTVISRPRAGPTSKRFCTRSPGFSTPGGVSHVPTWYDDQVRNSHNGGATGGGLGLGIATSMKSPGQKCQGLSSNVEFRATRQKSRRRRPWPPLHRGRRRPPHRGRAIAARSS
jgi:hypothetical protein